MQNTTEQIELCLARALRELRELRSEQQKAKQGENDVLPFLPEGGAPLPAGEESEQFHEHAVEDPFSFLQQDPFENVSIQDCMHEMTLKLGDEGFCFVMQVCALHPLHRSSSTTSASTSPTLPRWPPAPCPASIPYWRSCVKLPRRLPVRW